MKKILWSASIVLLTIIISVCNNPFWPDIDFGDNKKINGNEDPQIPQIDKQPCDNYPDGVKYFMDAETVYDLEVKASVTDGGVLTYQWYSYSESDPESVMEIEGAVNATFTPPVNEKGETFYYVVVTNTLNGKTAEIESERAKVSVIDKGEYEETYILEVHLQINPPEVGEIPDTDVSGYDSEKCEPISVEWSDGTDIPPNEFFEEIEYTVTVTLSALPDWKFAEKTLLSLSINENPILLENIILSDEDSTLTISWNFAPIPKSGKSIIDFEIINEPSNHEYTHGLSLNLSGLAITVFYEDESEEDIWFDDFADFETLITTVPANGDILSHTNHNNKPVKVSLGGFTKDTAELIVNKAPIMSAAITVTAPVTGETPNATATGTGNFSIGSATWTPTVASFQANVAYTVSVEITAGADYTFNGGLTTRTINSQNAGEENDGLTAVISYTFPATGARAVNNITIKQQPANLTYNHDDTLDLTGLEVTLRYNDNTTEDFALVEFGANNITTIPANGATLSRALNNTPVTVSFNGLNPATVNTNNLTIDLAPINEAILTVTAPATGATPGSASGTGNFTVTATAWNPTTTPFRGSTQYTVSVTLTANTNYTFTGGLSTATISGQTATITNNTGNAVTLSYQFPATAAKTVSSITLNTNPRLTYNHGQPLDLSGLIINRIYNDSTTDTLAFASFGTDVTTVPANETTLSIPTHNGNPVRVTYSGLTPVDTGNLVISPAPILDADVTVLTVPATGAAVSTEASGTGNFTVGTITWTPNDTTFQPLTRYTASVVLTANTNYTFTGGLTTATIMGETATVSNRSASTATLTYQFELTSDKTITGLTVTTQPTNLTYNHGQTLSLSGMVATIRYNNDPQFDEIVPYSDFVSKGLSTEPSSGTNLSRIIHDGMRVTVRAGTVSNTTNPLEINRAPITNAALTATAPVTGVTPNTTVTGTGNFTIGSASWNPTTTPFRGSTQYTVSVTLTVTNAELFTFTGLSTATISGQTATITNNTGNAVTLSYQFPATAAKTVSSITLNTNPRLTYNHGQQLDLSGLIINRIYNDSTTDTLAYASFGTDVTTNYTNGTTLSIPTHNGRPVIVTYTGLTPVNTGNLVINPAPIASVNLSIPVPATAGIPGTATGSGNFSITSTTWTQNHNPFRGGTQYTVSVALTANANYTFTGGLTTATFNNNLNAAVVNNGSTATLSYQFPATAPATVTNMVIKDQPTNLTYTHGQTLNLTGLVVTLSYSDSTSADIPLGSFAANGLTTLPANGATLTHSANNGHGVRVTHNVFGFTNTANLTVNKAAGTTVQNTFAVTPGTTATTVIITTAELVSHTEQTVIEYAFNTTGDTPTNWADLGPRPFTISGLTQGTQYHVFVRAKESANFNAGVSLSRTVRTLTNLTNITITFNPNADIALTATPGDIVISRSGNTQQTLTLQGASFDSIQWFINGSPVTGATGSSYTLSGNSFNQFTPVQSQLYVEVVRSGITYNLTIPFRVNP